MNHSLTQVPTNWDETRMLYAEMDKCIIVARRNGNAWDLGGMTAGEARTLDLPLKFLGDGTFEVEPYLDEAASGPSVVRRQEQTVSAADALQVKMPPSGDFAARLMRTDR